MNLTVLAPDPDGPVVRHRWRALVPALTEVGFERIRFVPLGKPAAQRLVRYGELRDEDVVVLVRKLLSRPEQTVLRTRVWRLVYDFDDALMYRDPARARPRSRVRQARFRGIVRKADLVLAGNAYLRDRAVAAEPRGYVRVAPTPVDTDRYRPAPRKDDGRVRLGWIGSGATRPFLESLAPVLERVVAARPEVELHVMADRAPELPGVRFTPWSEAAETDFLSGLDIGLGPLPDHPFTRGKCGFKLLQYAASGVPFVASPVGVQVELAEEGRVGLLPTDHRHWERALTELVDDPERRGVMGAAARESAERRWSVQALGPALARRLERLVHVGLEDDRGIEVPPEQRSTRRP